MDGGYLVDALSFIGLHADALRTIGSFQVSVLNVLPGLSPCFGIVTVIPIGSEDFSELPLAVLALDPVAFFIKDILAVTLRQPVPLFVQSSHGQHDVDVRIVIRGIGIVNGNIGYHAFGNELVLNILADHFVAGLQRKLSGKSDMQLPRHLRVPVGLR